MFNKFFKSIKDKLNPQGKKGAPKKPLAIPFVKSQKQIEDEEKIHKKREKRFKRQYANSNAVIFRPWKNTPKKKNWIPREERRKEAHTKFKPTKEVPKNPKAKIAPTRMPAFDPIAKRPHGEGVFSPTSRFVHKVWPFKKKSA